MKTADINATARYSVDDERLGDPGIYAGTDILAQLAIFAACEDEAAETNEDADWNITEVRG